MRGKKLNPITLTICIILLLATASAAPIVDMDYGDCPEPYPTLLADNGARHGPNDPNLYLGEWVDFELDGQPTIDANGDDVNGVFDDEDGVYFLTNLIKSGPADVNVIASKAGLLDAWMDFNNDGDFNDPGERIFTSFPLNQGNNILTLNVPNSRVPWGCSETSTISASTYARFRFSSAGGLEPNGPADDGEVEDYKVEDELDCLIGGNAGPAEYYDWAAWGKPKCWCYPYQCRGDADCLMIGFWRVNAGDLKCIRAAFFKHDPELVLIPNGICCDFDHKKIGFWRVNAADLAIFREYFFVTVIPDCNTPPIYTGPYNFWTCP